ncbi:MAG: hypothetical protein HY727_11550, partial [Candidatus Rokubacteria bacterium]|nr:hypothetical protein [Candidatus Rokubacteria bacterium]
PRTALNLYAESSAVLGWLLGEARADLVRHTLSRAEIVLASDLTLVEWDRILIRRQAAGTLSGAAAIRLHGDLGAAARRWSIMRIEGDVVGGGGGLLFAG